MDKNIYDWITSSIIIGIWAYIAFRCIREYFRMKSKYGLSSFMTSRDIKAIKDPATANAIKEWKKLTRRLFLLWVITCIVSLLLSMIIDRTIGFANK